MQAGTQVACPIQMKTNMIPKLILLSGVMLIASTQAFAALKLVCTATLNEKFGPGTEFVFQGKKGAPKTNTKYTYVGKVNGQNFALSSEGDADTINMITLSDQTVATHKLGSPFRDFPMITKGENGQCVPVAISYVQDIASSTFPAVRMTPAQERIDAISKTLFPNNPMLNATLRMWQMMGVQSARIYTNSSVTSVLASSGIRSHTNKYKEETFNELRDGKVVIFIGQFMMKFIYVKDENGNMVSQRPMNVPGGSGGLTHAWVAIGAYENPLDPNVGTVLLMDPAFGTFAAVAFDQSFMNAISDGFVIDP